MIYQKFYSSQLQMILGSIPDPLRDRLEIIEISSYTEQEKLEIAKRHLLKKELAKVHGLKP